MNREFLVSKPELYRVRGLDEVDTPRPLFFEWALLANRDRLKMMSSAFDTLRLMVKTFKSSQILKYYTDEGLERIKASSVREARAMVSTTPIRDVLIAFPLFGSAIDEFLSLRREFADRPFSVIVNNIDCATRLSAKADDTVNVYLDVDPGMRRTGVRFAGPLIEFARKISSLPRLNIVGLHVYDGHIHHPNPHTVSDYSMALMKTIDDSLGSLANICRVREVVTSSSLTMKSNLAAHRDGGYNWKHTVSPGTSALWDSNYNDIIPGAYDYACAIATRIVDVVSNAGSHIITTDCGVKLGASTDAGPVHVLSFDGYRFSSGYERHGSFGWLGHNREDWAPVADSLVDAVGKVILVFPKHVCPTINHYDHGYLVREDKIAEKITIDARDG